MSKDPTYRSDQEDFEKYFGDRLSDKERHDLESHALEDEFEAEAMEGWEAVPADVAKADIADLRDRLKPEKKSFNWFKVAAAVALLIVASVVVLTNIDQQPDTLAQETKMEEPIVQEVESIELESHEPEEELVSAQESEEQEVNELEDLIESPVNNLTASEDANSPDIDVIGNSRTTAPVLQAKSQVSEENAVASLDVSELDIVASETETPVQVLAAEGLDQKAVRLRPETNLYSAASDDFFEVKSKSDWTYRQLQGSVLDEEGHTVSDARIVLNGTNILAVSDFSGKFEMAIPDSLVTPTLTFSFAGFDQLRYNVDESDTFDVVLAHENPSSDNDELTYSFNSFNARKSNADSQNYDERDFAATTPEVGLKKYEKYLKKNTQVPEEAKRSGIKGTVVVSVKVDITGKLSDIKVIRGLGAGCDEEAIRVVQEGPAWTPAKSGGEAIEVTTEVEVKFN